MRSSSSALQHVGLLLEGCRTGADMDPKISKYRQGIYIEVNQSLKEAFSDFRIGVVEPLSERRHQDRVTHSVTIVHVPQLRQASIFLQRVPRVVGTSEFSKAS